MKTIDVISIYVNINIFFYCDFFYYDLTSYLWHDILFYFYFIGLDSVY